MSEVKEKKVELPVFSSEGKEMGQIEVNSGIFAVEVNPKVLYEATEAYLANQRQGTAKTKTRSEVAGSTRKLFRQKGTGRARAGSRRSPTRIGGGVAFGTTPRDYRKPIPKKVRRLALFGALSARAASAEIKVLDALNLDAISTKAVAATMSALGYGEALETNKAVTLLITDNPDEILGKSARNIPGLSIGRAEDLNAYEVLKYRNLLFTREGLDKLQEVFG